MQSITPIILSSLLICYGGLVSAHSSLVEELQADIDYAQKSYSDIEQFYARLYSQGMLQPRMTFSYAELDQASIEATGKSFFAFMSEAELFSAVFTEETNFRSAFEHSITTLRIGDYTRTLALYTLFARESRGVWNDDGTIEVKSFSGMNIPHRIIVKMFNEVFPDIFLDEDNQIHGVGKMHIRFDAQAELDTLHIDFDNQRISPELMLRTELGTLTPITTQDIAKFLSFYLAKDDALIEYDDQAGRWVLNTQRTTPQALDLYSNLPTMAVIRHEVFHALFSAHPDFRMHIMQLAASSNTQQREMAMLFVATHYNIFDPEIVRLNPYIVIDEAYNAYYLEDAYNIITGASRFSIARFAKHYNIDLSLHEYAYIHELPVDSNTQQILYTMYADIQAEHPELDQATFLHTQTTRILSNINTMDFLRILLIQQHPDLYKLVQQASKVFITDLLIHTQQSAEFSQSPATGS